jgi:mannosyltransferase
VNKFENKLSEELDKIPDQKAQKLFQILILVAIFITLVVRIYNIEQKNVWFDEVYSWKLAQESFIQVIGLSSGDIHPPLYYIVLKIWMMVFGDSVFSIRFLSVVFSMFSLIFIYKICNLIFKDSLQTFLVIFLYAVSPLNIYYSQEARMLNLNMLLCLGSIYYFILLINNYKTRYSVFYVIYSFLALYTHYFASFIIFTQFLIVLFEYRSKVIPKELFKKILWKIGIAVLLFLPWIPVFIAQTSKGQTWRTQQGIWKVTVGVYDYFREMFFSYYAAYESNLIIYSVTALTIFLILFFIYRLIKFYKSDDRKDKHLFYISLLFLVPLLIATIISFRQSILLSRYLSILVPLILIAKVGLYFKIKKKYLTYTIVIILIASSLYGIFLNYDNDFKNNDYRRIMDYIEKTYQPGEQIVVEPHYMGWMIEYANKQGETQLPVPKIMGYTIDAVKDSIKNDADSLGNLWVVLDYSAVDDNGYDEFTNFMNEQGFELDGQKTFYLIPDKTMVMYFRKLEGED